MEKPLDPFQNQSLLDFRCGLLEAGLKKIGLDGCASDRSTKRILFFVFLAWFPPIFFGELARYFYPTEIQIPILLDFSFHVRCIVAIPILLLSECRVQHQFNNVLPSFRQRDILGAEGTARLSRLGKRVQRLQASWRVDIVLVLLALSIVQRQLYLDLPSEIVHWKAARSALFDVAQTWNKFVTMPLYYYLILRWLWRFFVWSYFIVRIALYFPVLKSLHPDRVGGLGFLLRLQKMFAIPLAGVSVVAAANIAMILFFSAKPLEDFYQPVGLYAVIINLILVLPTLFYTPPLVVSRHRGLVRYGRLGNQYAAEFDHKWLNPRSHFLEVVGTPDIQSLNDLHGSYRSQAQMRIILMDVRTISAITVTILAPFVPLLLFKFPVMKLLTMIAKYFFNI